MEQPNPLATRTHLRRREFRDLISKTIDELHLPLCIRSPWYRQNDVDPDHCYIVPRLDAFLLSDSVAAAVSDDFLSEMIQGDYLLADMANGVIERCVMNRFYDDHTVDRAARIYTCFLTLVHAIGQVWLPFPEGLTQPNSVYVRKILYFARKVYNKKPPRDAERTKELEAAVWSVWFNRASQPGTGALFKLYEREFQALIA